jgi:hypothetical protein
MAIIKLIPKAIINIWLYYKKIGEQHPLTPARGEK